MDIDQLDLTKRLIFGSFDPQVDPNLYIREDSLTSKPPSVTYNMQEYLTTGAGRYARPSAASIVDAFFGDSLSISHTLHDGVYTLSQLRDSLHLTDSNLGTNFSVSQYVTDTNSSDYIERAYIFGSTSFTTGQDMLFKVEDGTYSIENLQLKAFDDNFDFESSDPIAQAANVILKKAFDPYGLIPEVNGHSLPVDILFTGPGVIYSSYSLSNYLVDSVLDVADKLVNIDDLPANLVIALAGLETNTGYLGAINATNAFSYYTEDGKKIIYGSAANDSLSPSSAELTLLTPFYHGFQMVGGGGDDTISGGTYADELWGGTGSDQFEGGLGNDSILGGDGDDTAIFSGLRTDYRIGGEKGGDQTVTNVVTGEVDTLSSIECIRFDSSKGNIALTNTFVAPGTSFVAKNDDGSSGFIDITSVFDDGLNFFGQTATGLYVNNNGNITFSGGLSTYTPGQIGGSSTLAIIAPFWADVDTRSAGSTVTYGLDADHGTFTATWANVDYYDATDGDHVSKFNSFQLELIDQGCGDFEIIFRYSGLNWVTGDASGGEGGHGGSVARAGFSSGDGVHYFELPQSGNEGAMLGLGNAGAGVWRFSVHNGEVEGIGTSGDDDLSGNDFANFMDGGAGDDSLNGGAGDDTIAGGAGDDTVIGGAGNDTLIAGHGEGDDSYDGGSDTDIITFLSTTLGVTVNLQTGFAEGQEIGHDSIVNVENATGGSGSDNLIGDANDNVLSGVGGDDEIDGGGGEDTAVFSGALANYTISREPDGSIKVTSVNSDEGVDTLIRVEKLQFSDQTYAAPVNHLPQASADTGSFNEGDTLLADVLANDSDPDGDTLDLTRIVSVSAGGTATIENGSVRVGYDGSDLHAGQSASITIKYEITDAFAGVGSGELVVTVNGLDESGDDIIGTNHADTLHGTSKGELMDGRKGADTITGKGGNDDLIGGLGSDNIRGGFGDDGIVGDSHTWNLGRNTDNDSLYGEAGDDGLYGNRGNDFLSGGSGADWLDGGIGKDTLTGGAGADQFQTRTFSLSDQFDIFTDFRHSDGDKILIDSGSHGSIRKDKLFYDHAPVNYSKECLVYDEAHGKLFLQNSPIMDDDVELLAVIRNHAHLSQSDFVFD